MRGQWFGDQFKNRVSREFNGRLTEATGTVLNTAQRLAGQGGGRPHVPSSPGQPPRRDTGSLVRSGQSHVVTEGLGIRGYVMFGGGNVPYAEALEYGTRKMAARPFVRPALDQSRNQIMRIMGRRL